MPLPLSLSLLAVVVVLFALRFAVPTLPLEGLARPLRPLDAVVAAVGVLGLVGHCGAMFYPDVIGLIPGIDGYMRAVNALGAASIVLYTVPALLIIIGLRRQHPVALAVLAAALLAVGITMYNGGSLNAHLTAISVSIVVLAVFAGLLIARIGRSERPKLQTSTQ